MVELLVEIGMDVNGLDKSEASPLHVAAFAGHMSIIRYLMKKGLGDDTSVNEIMTTLVILFIISIKIKSVRI